MTGSANSLIWLHCWITSSPSAWLAVLMPSYQMWMSRWCLSLIASPGPSGSPSSWRTSTLISAKVWWISSTVFMALSKDATMRSRYAVTCCSSVVMTRWPFPSASTG